MPIWKFSQTGGKTAEIENKAGFDVAIAGDGPHREIAETVGLSALIEAFILEDVAIEAIGLSASFEVEQAEYGIQATFGADGVFEIAILAGTLPAALGIAGTIAAEVEYRKEVAHHLGLFAGMEAVSLSDAISEGLGLQEEFQASAEAYRENANACGLSASFDGFNWSEFLRRYGDRTVKRYYFTLTGARDGLDDVAIPIASFQTRIRNQDPTFLSVSIPGADWADEISDRSKGDLIVHMAYVVDGNEVHREEIVRVELETIDIHEGGVNTSIVLTGHKAIDWGAPKNIPLSGVTYRRTTNGITRLRTSAPDMYLKPGDCASHGGDTIVVEQISIFVGPTMSIMELAGQ